MKHFTLLLLLIIFSCKSETKTSTENSIDNSVVKMWNNYTNANPEFKNTEIPESWFFHDNEKDANRLGQLTLNQKKRASSGLYSWYKEANTDLPKVGTKHIITDFNGKALCIIKITKVDTIPFNKISSNYAALDMGNTIQPLKKWKKAHWNFFESALRQNNKKATQNMLVVCEEFELVWK